MRQLPISTFRSICADCGSLTDQMFYRPKLPGGGHSNFQAVPGQRLCPRCGPVPEWGVIEARDVVQALEATPGVIKLGKAPYRDPKTVPSWLKTGRSANSRLEKAVTDEEWATIVASASS